MLCRRTVAVNRQVERPNSMDDVSPRRHSDQVMRELKSFLRKQCDSGEEGR